MCAYIKQLTLYIDIESCKLAIDAVVLEMIGGYAMPQMIKHK